MIKTLIALSGAALLLAPSLHAQGRRFAGGRGFEHVDRGHYRGHGHYYYLGGIPYFYPYYDIGFGYPSYYYGYGVGYNVPYYGNAYPEPAYEGRIVNENGSEPGASLPGAVQKQLAKRGYYKGSIDGEFGPATRGALSRFQRDNNLKETGRIDEATLQALGFLNHR
jgi:hypothetical protein